MGRVRFAGPVKSDGGYEIGSGIGTNTEIITSAGVLTNCSAVLTNVTVSSITIGSSKTPVGVGTITAGTTAGTIDFSAYRVYAFNVTAAATLTFSPTCYAGAMGTIIVRSTTAFGTSAAITLVGCGYTLSTITTTAITPSALTITFVSDGTKFVEIARMVGQTNIV